MPSTSYDVRYEADERPPLPPTLGLGLQYAVLALAGVVLTPTILISVAGRGEAIIYGKITDVPAGTPVAAAPVTAVVTLAAIVLVALRLSGAWRGWAPAVRLAAGGVAGLAFGIYDLDRVAAAPRIGLPDLSGYSGLDPSFDTRFWALLPGFPIVTLVGAM